MVYVPQGKATSYIHAPPTCLSWNIFLVYPLDIQFSAKDARTHDPAVTPSSSTILSSPPTTHDTSSRHTKYVLLPVLSCIHIAVFSSHLKDVGPTHMPSLAVKDKEKARKHSRKVFTRDPDSSVVQE